MATEAALVRLLCDAGLSQEQARWLAFVLDHIRDWPDGSDGLAGPLLRWRRQEAVDAYAAGVSDAVEALQALRKAGVLDVGVRTTDDLVRTFELRQIDPVELMGDGQKD